MVLQTEAWLCCCRWLVTVIPLRAACMDGMYSTARGMYEDMMQRQSQSRQSSLKPSKSGQLVILVTGLTSCKGKRKSVRESDTRPLEAAVCRILVLPLLDAAASQVVR